MADNLELNSGSGGAILAADEIGPAFHQRVKVQHGEDGSASDVASSSPLPSDLVLEDPKSAAPSAVGVAPSGTADLDSDQISAGKTGRLIKVEFGATVPTKAELTIVANGVAGSVVARSFAWAGQMGVIRAPTRQFWTVAYDVTAGLDGFRLTVTNLGSETADLYANHLWDEAD